MFFRVGVGLCQNLSVIPCPEYLEINGGEDEK